MEGREVITASISVEDAASVFSVQGWSARFSFPSKRCSQLFDLAVLWSLVFISYIFAAGCRKIPGISYPDGLEFAKRSKYVAWRAAVEMSETIAQFIFLASICLVLKEKSL